MMIFSVLTQVLGQLVYSFSKNGHLHLRRPGIPIVKLKLINNYLFFFRRQQPTLPPLKICPTGTNYNIPQRLGKLAQTESASGLIQVISYLLSQFYRRTEPLFRPQPLPEEDSQYLSV